MKSEETIRGEIRKLRSLIDAGPLSHNSIEECYGAEHALYWVLAKRGYERNYIPHRACITDEERMKL